MRHSRSRRNAPPRVALWITVAAALLATLVPGHAIPQIYAQDEPNFPIFDTHIHYSQDAWAQFSVDDALSILDQAGIYRAMVSSTPDEGTLMLYQRDPGRIIPVLRPYRTRADMTTWTTDPSVLDYLEGRINGAPYRAFGELHISGDEVGHLVPRTLAVWSVSRGLAVHAHTGADGAAALARAYPDVNILWAHAGMSASAATTQQILRDHPNVWVELALRGDVAPGGTLDPAWAATFAAYPSRVMIGTDTWVPSQWARLPRIMAAVQVWLKQLPRDVAEQIAHRNAERLFGP
ncbi:MAG: amidohydrolase family protein [Chloroflexota bacterium]